WPAGTWRGRNQNDRPAPPAKNTTACHSETYTAVNVNSGPPLGATPITSDLTVSGQRPVSPIKIEAKPSGPRMSQAIALARDLAVGPGEFDPGAGHAGRESAARIPPGLVPANHQKRHARQGHDERSSQRDRQQRAFHRWSRVSAAGRSGGLGSLRGLLANGCGRAAALRLVGISHPAAGQLDLAGPLDHVPAVAAGALLHGASPEPLHDDLEVLVDLPEDPLDLVDQGIAPRAIPAQGILLRVPLGIDAARELRDQSDRPGRPLRPMRDPARQQEQFSLPPDDVVRRRTVERPDTDRDVPFQLVEQLLRRIDMEVIPGIGAAGDKQDHILSFGKELAVAHRRLEVLTVLPDPAGKVDLGHRGHRSSGPGDNAA